MIPRLALVPGEPAGVGPELCVRLAHGRHHVRLVAYGDPDALARAARRLTMRLTLREPDRDCGPGELAIVPVPQAVPERPGTPDPRNAQAVVSALLAAADDCVAGRSAAMVTGPVHKANINAGGIHFLGTTGLLAEHAGTEVVMMLATPGMRVALATTHLPLREVADAIAIEPLMRCLRIVDHSLREDFGICAPTIAVLGLNPHAGEGGVLGREEIDVIVPAIERLRAEGLNLEGPLPADTAFLPGRLARTDAVLAMYHDQGLPVLKHSGFEEAINISLGLPYPRVAVDHGTALDIAGLGQADPSSLFAAVAQARAFALRRSGHARPG